MDAKTTEAYFIDHCDGGCGLGRVHIECPSCNRNFDDFSIWWLKYEIMDGEENEFMCEYCDVPLLIRYNQREFIFEVINLE